MNLIAEIEKLIARKDNVNDASSTSTCSMYVELDFFILWKLVWTMYQENCTYTVIKSIMILHDGLDDFETAKICIKEN